MAVAIVPAAMLPQALVAQEAGCRRKAVAVLAPLEDIRTTSFIMALVERVAHQSEFQTLVVLLLADRAAAQVVVDTMLALRQLQAVCLGAPMH